MTNDPLAELAAAIRALSYEDMMEFAGGIKPGVLDLVGDQDTDTASYAAIISDWAVNYIEVDGDAE